MSDRRTAVRLTVGTWAPARVVASLTVTVYQNRPNRARF